MGGLHSLLEQIVMSGRPDERSGQSLNLVTTAFVLPHEILPVVLLVNNVTIITVITKHAAAVKKDAVPH